MCAGGSILELPAPFRSLRTSSVPSRSPTSRSTKTIGAIEAPPRVRRFTHLLQTVRLALAEILPKVEETLAASFENLKQQWNRQGGRLAVAPRCRGPIRI